MRAHVIAPILDAAVVLCMVMSFMLLLEAVFMSTVSVYVKLFRRTPEKRYKWEAMGGDAEKGGLDYPMVLVQIPMYNEKEVSDFFLSPLGILACLLGNQLRLDWFLKKKILIPEGLVIPSLSKNK